MRKKDVDSEIDDWGIYNTWDSTPEEMFGDKIKCKVCGFFGTGYGTGMFCQNCASSLDNDLEENQKWLYKGNNYQMKQEFEKAIQFFEQHIKLNPQDPLAYFYIGRCLAEMNEHKQALTWYGKIKDVDAKFQNGSEYNFQVGKSYLAIKQYKSALFFIDRSLEIFPQHRIAKLVRAEILNVLKDQNE